MQANILEIFKSIQGEGPYAGVPQVFVRFFECNMHCSWCDTPNSIGDTTRNFKEYAADKLLSEVKELWDDCHSVSFTGGEPLLQADIIKALVPQLKKSGMRVYLETNGTLPDQLAEIIDDVDITAMDIKLPSSTKCRAYWKEHREFLKIARAKEVFIKAVISSDTNEKDVSEAMDLVADIDPNILFILQPNYFEMQNGVIKKCVEFQGYGRGQLNDVRIIPQIHKFMKVP